MNTTKELILTSLRGFVAQRPRLEFGNYGDWRNYRAEMRSITRDLNDAKTLLRAVEISSIPIDGLRAAFRAYSGRLILSDTPDGKLRLEYCTGQYFPTEYRKAVCAVCAAALLDYYWKDFSASARNGESAGDAIRRKFREWFGRRMQKHWFA